METRVCALCSCFTLSHLPRVDGGNPRTLAFGAFVQFIAIRAQFRKNKHFRKIVGTGVADNAARAQFPRCDISLCCVVHTVVWLELWHQKWISKILISIRAQSRNRHKHTPSRNYSCERRMQGDEWRQPRLWHVSVREISGVINEFRVCLWFFHFSFSPMKRGTIKLCAYHRNCFSLCLPLKLRLKFTINSLAWRSWRRWRWRTKSSEIVGFAVSLAY